MEKSDNNDRYLNKDLSKDLNKDKVVEVNRISNARKEGLTKGVLITAIIGCILLMGSLIIVYSSYKGNQREQLAQMDQQKYSFSKQINERDSLINDWLLTFDQIEK